ncbi:type I secretion system permease/ATPase [Halodesulfovibrio aestuarii]|uniref:ATP-binding cassette, subfamily C, LapB n=1 Tax=Halodesulfovibrio aestuarii TaxID=126333 RepID=A0A8G2FIC2_9BACT|nr:type I secretion system permease/ATPase [Halodesulfovibrio aestuarii]SHJ30777.1 ATP-binding cassette, subfamily C, LapB [Halodesulfovibrio aestuarii]
MTDSNHRQPVPETTAQSKPDTAKKPSFSDAQGAASEQSAPPVSHDNNSAQQKQQSPQGPKTIVDAPLPSDVDYESPLLRSLVHLFSLLGKPLTLEQLKTGLPEHGTQSHTSACLRAALQAGMNAKAVRRNSLAEISTLTLPCIILLKNKGAGVLTSLTETHAKVVFPEMNSTPISVLRDKLEEEYAGYVIFGQIKGRLDKRASELKLLKTKRWFWDTILYFLPIYKHVGLASIIINLLAISSPLFFMNVYDRVVPNNATDTLWVLAMGIGIALLFDFMLRNLRSYFCDVAGKNADIILASRLMQHVMALRLDDKPDSTGTMANNLREFESLREFFSSTTLLAIIDVPFLFFFLTLIHYIGGPLVLIPATAIPIVIIVGLLLQFPFQRAVESGFKEGAQKYALLIEIINGIETVKTSMAEGHMQQMWEKVVGMSAKSSNSAKHLANFSMTFTMFAAQTVSVFLIAYGVYRIADGKLTMGGLIACNILAGRSMAPLSQIAGMLSRMQQSRMALKSLDMIMQLPTEAQEEYTGISYEKLDASITFDSLAFKYPNAERFAIEDIHLKIHKGERVGIIGRMGSGKSTLGKLCVGLYRPTEGAVKLGGVDIRQMDIADLRSRTGYVSQDNYLFYGTVRDNIAIGNPQADENAILRAASIAGVTEFIQSNPAGFGLQVGERGMALSGGQRQSIALARALLTNPDIIILDEPSSNMDNGSEFTFKRKLAHIIPGKTLILITHRFSMLDVVDRLIVMDNGKVVADGPKAAVLDALRKDQIKKAPTRAA